MSVIKHIGLCISGWRIPLIIRRVKTKLGNMSLRKFSPVKLKSSAASTLIMFISNSTSVKILNEEGNRFKETPNATENPEQNQNF